MPVDLFLVALLFEFYSFEFPDIAPSKSEHGKWFRRQKILRFCCSNLYFTIIGFQRLHFKCITFLQIRNLVDKFEIPLVDERAFVELS